MLQAYLDLRSIKEIRHDSVVGSDGVVRDRCRHDKVRHPETIFSKVEVERWGYAASECNSLFPYMDDFLVLTTDGKGEKRNWKRMATVAAVYSIGPNERTAEEVMGVMKTEDEVTEPEKKQLRAKNKRVWASLEKDPDVVIDDVFLEAHMRDPEHLRRWVFLVDGDRHQLNRIHDFAELHEVEVTVIVDIIHVLEYLWKASYGFFPEGSEEAEKWVTERELRILRGKSSQVAAGMPIATGVIEGACRHLVKDRMDLTGARWSLLGAEADLKLRALRSSKDFDEDWEFHKKQEHKRNHASNYAVDKAV